MTPSLNGKDDAFAGKKKRAAPQPGDADFKTSTQLRNARKRRRLKNDKKHTGSAPQSQRQSDSKPGQISAGEDPSLRYLASPLNAPVVQRAIQFFRNHPAQSSDTFDVIVGPTTGWRTVAKLAVRLSSGCLRIGLFAPGTHDLLEIPQCPAHHSRINSAVQVLQKKCRQLDIPPYSEKTGLGNLRHVLINVDRATGQQQITLVWKENDHEKKDPPALLRQLCDELVQMSENKHFGQLEIHSLWVHYNNASKHDNNVVDRNGRWEQQHGPSKAVIEHLNVEASHLTVPLEFPPQVFRQANIDAFSDIIVKIRSWIQERQTQQPIRHCLELYGGVGTIGLHLVDLMSESLVSSDENPFNKQCFERTLNRIQVKEPYKQCKSIRYESKSATDMVLRDARSDLDRVNLVVVDPPRKGLDSEVLKALGNGHQFPHLHSLVYVSCGFEAFCRDYDALVESGEWRLDHAEGHLLFPGSDAIETLAFFTREKAT